MTKTWTLTIQDQPVTLTLAPPSERGCCASCLLKKTIQIVSQRSRGFKRKFCFPCTLENLGELEKEDYGISPKVIQAVRSSLIFGE